MTTEGRRDRERKRIRAAFLDAARALLVAEGYEALTMRKVAERAEYSPAAIYTHFQDKEALVKELCANDFSIFTASLTGVLAIADARDRLAALANAYVKFGMRHPEHYRLLFLSPKKVETKDDATNGPETEAYDLLVTTVKYALSQGMFPHYKRKPHLVAQTMWAGMHGIVGLELAFRNDPLIHLEPLEERAALMQDLLIDGLAVDKKRR